MILEGRGLAIGYRGRVIGRDLDIRLAAGSVLALLGPNGCGKTTLLKSLIGLLPTLAGSVVVGGRPLAALSVAERARQIAYVPQSHAGTFPFTVSDVVLMGRTAHHGLFFQPSGSDHRAAAQALDRLGIAHLANRPYTRTSGGERQLVLIARALAQDARIVVLDEPTSSLDFGNQGRTLRVMRALARDGMAVLFTTHDPNAALHRADRVALFSAGQLLIEGPAVEVVTRDRLETVYGAPMRMIGSDDDRAYLPG